MLPIELQERKQWVVAGADKRPYFWNGGLVAASVIDPSTWMSYEDACSLASFKGLSVGYVLSKDDPFVCIDFDIRDCDKLDKNSMVYPQEMWTPEVVIKQQDFIINSIDSYKELSVSRKGIHVWVKGESGPGARRGGVEVYSQERFIICTGLGFNSIERSIVDGRVVAEVQGDGLGISDQDEFLKKVLGSLREVVQEISLVELDEVESDQVIWERASGAANNEKFKKLCDGDWQGLNYPSQSEADFALLSMFTFYSKSNSQCRRLFRMTGLGQREKCNKNDVHLNRMLLQIRSRQAHEESLNLKQQLESLLLAKVIEKQIDVEEVEPTVVIDNCLFNAEYDFNQVYAIDNPPGVMGEICEFIYGAAPRPVKEVSIVAGLGFVAGCAGKAYHLEQTGLNLYLILVARSAVGKEAMHSGISYLVRDLSRVIPETTNFVNYNEFVSSSALVKSFKDTPSFVNIAGELGRRIAAMSKDMVGPLYGLRTTIVNLYQKSAPGSSVGGLEYSDKDKKAEIKGAVAYSMIGETTPGVLFDALTEEMMEDGFLSRFSIIQYEGDRVPLNYHTQTKVPQDLLDKLSYILAHCVTGNADREFEKGIGHSNSIRVKLSDAAWILQFNFNIHCDKEINKAGDKESLRQMWNRSHLKALRISGLLAVCDNPSFPVVTIEHMKWAINIVLNDVKLIGSKLKGGDIGNSDDVRVLKLVEVCQQYFKLNNADLVKLKIDPDIKASGVIPRQYLQMRTCAISSFRNHKMGSTMALNQAIGTMIDNGKLVEIDKITRERDYGTSGKLYRLVSL